MTPKTIRYALIAFCLGFFTNLASADDPCPPPCADENNNNICDEDERDPNSDSMPQELIVDDMPADVFVQE